MTHWKAFVFVLLVLATPILASSNDECRLYFDVIPKTSICFVDDEMVDHKHPVPATYGVHKIKVTHPGYPDYAEQVNVDSDSVLVRVFPIKVNYSPPGSTLKINGSKVQYDDRKAAYLFCKPGVMDIKVTKGLLSKSKQEQVLSPYSEYQTGLVIKSREQKPVWGHFFAPELVYYPSTGITAASIASLGLKS